jgi:hypothetical protein
VAKKTKKNPETITKTKLTTTYWLGAHRELERLGYLGEREGREKGAVAVYDVLKPLPGQAALAEAIKPLYTKSFTDWYEDAKGDMESLQEEISSWRDNMEGTGLENTSKFEQVSECADQLDNAVQAVPEKVPEAVKDLKVFVSPITLRVSASYRSAKKFRGGPSRAARLDEATGIVETLMDAARQKREDAEVGKQSAKSEALQVELEEFEGELQNALDEAQSVDFPGMF